MSDTRINLEPRDQHEAAVCQRDARQTFYVYKGHKSLFRCPACGRSCFQALNFLGRRLLMCDGVKFTKVQRQEVEL